MKLFSLSLVSVLYSCNDPDQNKVSDTFPSPKIETVETEPLSNERYIHRITLHYLHYARSNKQISQ